MSFALIEGTWNNDYSDLVSKNDGCNIYIYMYISLSTCIVSKMWSQSSVSKRVTGATSKIKNSFRSDLRFVRGCHWPRQVIFWTSKFRFWESNNGNSNKFWFLKIFFGHLRKSMTSDSLSDHVWRFVEKCVAFFVVSSFGHVDVFCLSGFVVKHG